MSCCNPKVNGVAPSGAIHSVVNVGGFVELYRTGTILPWELRTHRSSDGSVSIVQGTTDVDFKVTAGSGTPDAFQTDSTATITTNSTTLTTFVTLAGDAKMLSGEKWKINMVVDCCVPTNGATANAEQVWQIETSAGVFTEVDRYSEFCPIAIAGNEHSQPFDRNIQVTAQMDAPRMRLQVRRTTAGATGYFWENPGWGGAQIAEA